MVGYDLLMKMVAEKQRFSERHLAGVKQAYALAGDSESLSGKHRRRPGGNEIQYTD
jgi:hypothetical protein